MVHNIFRHTHMSTSWGPIFHSFRILIEKNIAKLLVNQSAKHLHNLSKCTFFNKLPRPRPRRPEAQDILNMFDLLQYHVFLSNHAHFPGFSPKTTSKYIKQLQSWSPFPSISIHFLQMTYMTCPTFAPTVQHDQVQLASELAEDTPTPTRQ